MLKKWHFELLKLIENEKKLPKIAELLNLTERSVRYKIDEINQELGKKKIEIKKRELFSTSYRLLFIFTSSLFNL